MLNINDFSSSQFYSEIDSIYQDYESVNSYDFEPEELEKMVCVLTDGIINFNKSDSEIENALEWIARCNLHAKILVPYFKEIAKTKNVSNYVLNILLSDGQDIGALNNAITDLKQSLSQTKTTLAEVSKSNYDLAKRNSELEYKFNAISEILSGNKPEKKACCGGSCNSGFTVVTTPAQPYTPSDDSTIIDEEVVCYYQIDEDENWDGSDNTNRYILNIVTAEWYDTKHCYSSQQLKIEFEEYTFNAVGKYSFAGPFKDGKPVNSEDSIRDILGEFDWVEKQMTDTIIECDSDEDEDSDEEEYAYVIKPGDEVYYQLSDNGTWVTVSVVSKDFWEENHSICDDLRIDLDIDIDGIQFSENSESTYSFFYEIKDVANIQFLTETETRDVLNKLGWVEKDLNLG